MGFCVSRIGREKNRKCLIPKKIVVVTTSLNTDRSSAYYSKLLKWLLEAKNIQYTEIDLSLLDFVERSRISRKYKKSKEILPVLYADDEFVGDFDKVQELIDLFKFEKYVYTLINTKKNDDHSQCAFCGFNKDTSYGTFD